MQLSRTSYCTTEKITFISVSPPGPRVSPGKGCVLALTKSTVAGTQKGHTVHLWNYEESELFYQCLFCAGPCARQSSEEMAVPG